MRVVRIEAGTRGSLWRTRIDVDCYWLVFQTKGFQLECDYYVATAATVGWSSSSRQR